MNFRILIAALAGASFLAACDTNDDAGEVIEDRVEETADAVGDAAEDAADEVEDTVDN